MWCNFGFAQVVTREDLPLSVPIVEVFTENGELPSFVFEPDSLIKYSEYLPARVIKYNGQDVVYDSQDYVKDVSGGRIRVRGNASGGWEFPGYKLKFSKKTDFLGLGYKEKEWYLIKPIPAWSRDYYLLDNVIGHEIGKLLGMEWQPNYELVNLFINEDYRGLYYITDAVEKNKSRCNIEATGFLIENDIYWQYENDVYFTTDHQDSHFAYTFKYPDPDDVTDSIKGLYRDYINDFEHRLYSNEDISSYIDLHTWAAWLLAHDILGSRDSWGTNMYIYKKDFDTENPFSSQMKLGPLWDFDSSLFLEEKWSEHHDKDYLYFKQLLTRRDFLEEFQASWNGIKGSLLVSLDSVFTLFASERIEDLNQCILLNNLRCDFECSDIEDNIAYTLGWIESRMQWIDLHISELEDNVADAIHQPSSAIPSDKAYYNLNGQRIEKPLSGNIYIYKGKRILR